MSASYWESVAVSRESRINQMEEQKNDLMKEIDRLKKLVRSLVDVTMYDEEWRYKYKGGWFIQDKDLLDQLKLTFPEQHPKRLIIK